MLGDEMVEVDGVVRRVTDRAILFESDGIQGWIPISLIQGGPEDYCEGDEITIEIPAWKAEEIW